MEPSPSRPSPSLPPEGGGLGFLRQDWICLLGLVGAFALLQLALAFQASGGRLIVSAPEGYYHYITDAVLSGQLALKVPPQPELVALANPYDRTFNRPYRKIDLSLYHGHYYFYWGLAPVVLLFGPVVLVTGKFISEALAASLFGLGGQVGMAWLILVCRRNYFPRAGWGLTVLAVLGAGTACYLPLLAVSNSVYGVAIASAAFCLICAWCCIYRALHSPSAPFRWTLLAGLALAFCLGSRPNYILWAGCLLWPLGLLLWRHPRQRWGLAAAAALPPLLGVGAMLAMNARRFGSLLEFGMRYQLTGPKQPTVFFQWANIVYNWNFYAWNSPHFIKVFPFVTTPGTGPLGMLNTLPAIYLVFGLFLARSSRLPKSLIWTMAAAGIGGLVGTCAFSGFGNRYMVDYLPASLLAGSLGALAAADALAGRSGRFSRWAIAAVLAATLALGVLPQMQDWGTVGDRLRLFARVFNAPRFWSERVTGHAGGPLLLSFRLPSGREGKYEPLLSVGPASDNGEIVFVNYVDSSHLRLGFFHTGVTHWLSDPVALDFSRAHELFVGLGSLLPPDSAPVFDRWTASARESAQQEVALKLDGRLIYQAHLDFGLRHDVDPVLPGQADLDSVCGPRFTGQLLGLRRVPIDPAGPGAISAMPSPSSPAATAKRYGKWRLRVRFPSHPPTGQDDPLLVSGVPGAGDFVYAFYPAPSQVAFGHDSWSLGGSASPTFSVDLSREHVIEISHPGLDAPPDPTLPGAASDQKKGRLRVWLDGTIVLDVADHTYPAAPETVTPAENRIGGSTTNAVFSGTVLSAERLAR